MEEKFWTELRSLSNEDLEKVIKMAQEQLETNACQVRLEALHKIFEGLQELAENDCKYLHIFEDDDVYITVDELAKYFIDKFDF